MRKKSQGRETEVLTDAGPLAALINRSDPNNSRVVEAQKTLPQVPLLTTWPCLTEAMYLLGQAAGQRGQDVLWGYVEDSLLLLHDLTFAERARMRVLMAKYADTPMDIADASLVAVAETQGLTRIFTVDGDFYVYRLADGTTLEVLPGPRRSR